MVKPDHYDLSIITGFASLVGGIWWLAPPVALIIGGVVLVGYGLYGNWLLARTRRQGRRE